jgi:hypothetical protein
MDFRSLVKLLARSGYIKQDKYVHILPLSITTVPLPAVVLAATALPKFPFAEHKSPQTAVAEATSALFVHCKEAQIDACAAIVCDS